MYVLNVCRKAPEGIFLRTADTSSESEELIRKWYEIILKIHSHTYIHNIHTYIHMGIRVAVLTNPFERSASMYVDSAVEAANLEAMVLTPLSLYRMYVYVFMHACMYVY